MIGASRNGRSLPTAMRIALAVYGTVFVLSTIISYTLYKYPLLSSNPEQDWHNHWLLWTMFDYYGACLCLGGIVLASEPTWARGLAWNMGFLFLGGPVCCLWVILRIQRVGSLRLVDAPTTTSMGRRGRWSQEPPSRTRTRDEDSAPPTGSRMDWNTRNYETRDL